MKEEKIAVNTSWLWKEWVINERTGVLQNERLFILLETLGLKIGYFTRNHNNFSEDELSEGIHLIYRYNPDCTKVPYSLTSSLCIPRGFEHYRQVSYQEVFDTVVQEIQKEVKNGS